MNNQEPVLQTGRPKTAGKTGETVLNTSSFDACPTAGFSSWSTGPAVHIEVGRGQVKAQEKHFFMDHQLYSTAKHFKCFYTKTSTYYRT